MRATERTQFYPLPRDYRSITRNQLAVQHETRFSPGVAAFNNLVELFPESEPVCSMFLIHHSRWVFAPVLYVFTAVEPSSFGVERGTALRPFRGIWFVFHRNWLDLSPSQGRVLCQHCIVKLQQLCIRHLRPVTNSRNYFRSEYYQIVGTIKTIYIYMHI